MKRILFIIIILISLILIKINVFAIYNIKPVNSNGYPYFIIVKQNNASKYIIWYTEKLPYLENGNLKINNSRYQTYMWDDGYPQYPWQFANSNQTNINNYILCSISSDSMSNTIIEANFSIGGYIYIPPYYSDYYISDTANMFNEGQIASLLEMEKKWEQNLNMQFFIKTYTASIPNEVQDLAAFGAGKSPTGNGSITLYIQDKPDGTYRFGLGISARAALSMPYNEFEHYRAWNYLKSSYDTGLLSVIHIENFFQLLYSDIMYKPADTTMFGSNTSGWYKYWKDKVNRTDSDSSEYSLLSDKINNVLRNDGIGSILYGLPEDKYGFHFEKYEPLNLSEEYNADGLHIWFGNMGIPEGSQTTPPAITIPEGDGLEPGQSTPGAIGVNPPAGADGESSGLLSAIWALLKAILSFIVSIFGLIGKALTYTTSIQGVEADSSLFNEYIIMSIQFLKNQNITALNVSLWAVFELMFTSAAIFVVIKFIQRTLNLAARGG